MLQSEIPDDLPVPRQDTPPALPEPNADTAPSAEPDHGRTGRIARLPKATRDQINHLIQDGVPYLQIASRLALAQFDIDDDHIHRWKQGGYRDWLRRDEWLDQMRTQVDFANDVLREESNPTLHQANLQVAATQIIQSLVDSGARLLAQDPQTYIRMVSVLCRLSREALAFEQYRHACAAAREKLNELRDPKRVLSDDERRAIVDKLDEILGLE